MTTLEAFRSIVPQIQGQPVAEGDIVAHPSTNIGHKFLYYDGNDAVVLAKDLTEHRFPRSEIYLGRKALEAARHLMEFGFWEEGLGCLVVTIREPSAA